jgi:signal transduction histidine kinase
MKTFRNSLRTLYGKIFLWFVSTILFTTIIVLAVAALTGSQPFGRRWMSLTQDLYARSAVDFYQTGGAPGLIKYLDALHRHSGIEGQLLDAQHHDVLGAPMLSEVGPLLTQVTKTGAASFRLGRVWTAASPITADGHSYTFVMQIYPMRGFVDGTFASPILPRILLGICLIAIFCLLLARHITEPIRVLEDAATQLAAGNLSVRASPRIAPRKDELARMATAFDTMADRIQSLLYAQQEMLGHISHELRSPLTRIGVSLELLRRGETDSLDQMQMDLDRMNQMIGEILQITRMDLEAHQPRQAGPQSLVDLCAVLIDIAHDAAFEAQHLQKSIVYEGEEHCTIFGDQSLLRSACENVVRNALLYTPANTTIHISLARNAVTDSTQIIIRDEGPGVPAEALPHLFQLFYRADAASAQHPEGTGFGLAIAQRIVAMHRGQITARNTVPHGLEVTLSFPLT